MSLSKCFSPFLTCLLLLFVVGFSASCSEKPSDGQDAGLGNVTGAACWWCLDAGVESPPDKSSGPGKNVDPVCYKACIGKGVNEDECAKKHCFVDPSATPKGVDEKCYKSCIAKGVSQKDCQYKYCSLSNPPKGVDGKCYSACIAKGAGKDVCTKACGGGGKDPGVDSKCYDACIKKGQKPDACKKACPGKGSSKSPCYDDCSKKGYSDTLCKIACPEGSRNTEGKKCYDTCLGEGKKPADCEVKCLGGGVAPKDKIGQACYDLCAKGGEKAENCKAKCFPEKTCKDKCLKEGKELAECDKKCASACQDQCMKDVGKEDLCKARCGNATSDPGKCDSKSQLSFSKDIKPIIQVCTKCHGAKASGGVNFTEHALFVGKKGKSGKLVVAPSDHTMSMMVHRLEGRGNLMPKGGPALPKESIQKIKDWICSGAKDN